MFGALSCYKVGDKLVYLNKTAVGIVLAVIGYVLLSVGFSLAQFIVGRFLLGFG